jgi:hypothetical protein
MWVYVLLSGCHSLDPKRAMPTAFRAQSPVGILLTGVSSRARYVIYRYGADFFPAMFTRWFYFYSFQEPFFGPMEITFVVWS